MPAPPTAREARFWKCQSFAMPSIAEYWHIGDTMMRLRAVTDRIAIGRKSCEFVSTIRMKAFETTGYSRTIVHPVR
jgi:hypothetical protein